MTPLKLSFKDRRTFAFKLIIGFPCVGMIWTALIFLFSSSGTLNFKIAYWIGGTGISIGTLCLISQFIGQIVWTTWNHIVSFIDTVIIWSTLPIFYYILFSPFAIFIRFFGKASMKIMTPNSPSFWKDVRQNSTKKQYFRQF